MQKPENLKKDDSLNDMLDFGGLEGLTNVKILILKRAGKQEHKSMRS